MRLFTYIVISINLNNSNEDSVNFLNHYPLFLSLIRKTCQSEYE